MRFAERGLRMLSDRLLKRELRFFFREPIEDLHPKIPPLILKRDGRPGDPPPKHPSPARGFSLPNSKKQINPDYFINFLTFTRS